MYMMWLFAVALKEKWLLVSDWLTTPVLTVSRLFNVSINPFQTSVSFNLIKEL